MKKLLLPIVSALVLLAGALLSSSAAETGPSLDEGKLLGTWKMDVVSGDNTTDYELRFSKAEGKLEAVLISPRSGEHKYKSVICQGSELVMELERERDGGTVTLLYKGKLTGEGLSGTMVTKGQEDQSPATWKATKPGGTADAPAATGLDEGKLVGTWKMDVASGDNTTDYELRFSKADGKLEAVLISPRSGEHKYKSVVCQGSDLVMELERERDGGTVTLLYKGKLTAEGLSGTMVTKGQEDQSPATWKATKPGGTADAGAPAGLDEGKLLGTWKMDVVTGDNTTDYELRFSKAEGKLEAVLISPRSGEHKYKSVVIQGSELVMELERERDGNTVTLIYKGKMTAEGLSGTMVTKGQESDTPSTWKATKPGGTADAGAAPGAAPGLDEAKLVGTWKMDVVTGDNTTDYELRFSKAEGKLEAVLISPRSGEHKYKSVVCQGSELVMELERERDGATVTLIYKGKLTGEGLSGTMVTKGQEDQSPATWKATKQ